MSVKRVFIVSIIAFLFPVWVQAKTNANMNGAASLKAAEFSVFIDFEARYANRRNFLDRGFTLNDASLVWKKALSSYGFVYLDLPVMAELDGDSNEFDVGERRPEAFLRFEKESYFLNFGQYATPFGYEASSSKARFFADWGPVRSYVLPKTHAGVLWGMRREPTTVFVQLANPNGSSAPGTEYVEVGAGVILQFSELDVMLGGTFSESQMPYPENRTNLLAEIRAGFGRERLRIDGSFNIKKSAGSDKSGGAFGILSTYNVNEVWTAGVRIEKLSDIYAVLTTGAGTFESVFATSAGALYRLQPDLIVRGDFTLLDMKAPGVDDVFQIVTVSTVAEF